MHFEPYWIALLVAPLVSKAVTASIRGRYAARKNGKLIFTAPGRAGLCSIAALLAGAIIVGGWNQEGRIATTVIGTGMLVWAILLMPTKLTLDDHGVKASYLWRPAKRLKYAEIDYATRAYGEIQVVGKGIQILHTKYHVDAGRFEAELRRRGVEQ